MIQTIQWVIPSLLKLHVNVLRTQKHLEFAGSRSEHTYFKVQIAFLITKEKISQTHHTVDITLTNGRSLLSFVFLMELGGTDERASAGENSTSTAAWLKANYAFSSVGAMVKIN